MRRSALVLTFCLLTLAIFANTLWQNPVPIRKGDQVDWNRCGAVTADGCMIYVWSGTIRGDRDIFAQKVSSNGTIIWQQPLLVEGKYSRQSDPVITRSSDNNFIIAWMDYPEMSNRTIRAQKITSGGQLLWLAGGVQVCSSNDYSDTIDIIADQNNGAYLVWGDRRNSYNGIYAQHLDTYGNAMWNLEGLVVAAGGEDYKYPSLAVDNTGALIVAYQFMGYPALPLYVQRILSNGDLSWTQPLWIADCYIHLSDKAQLAPTVEDTFIITWQGLMSAGSDENIYAQRFNLNGSTLWGINHIVYFDSGTPYPTVQLSPRIVSSSTNFVVIAWLDLRSDDYSPDIYAQRLDYMGNLTWNPSGVPISTETGNQQDLRLVSDGLGGAVITWEDWRSNNYPEIDIYAQHVNATGIPQWESNGRPICTAPAEQSHPMLRKINNNYFIGWMDQRSGSPALYYQVLSELGNPLLTADGKLIHQGLRSIEYYQESLKNLARSNDTAIFWIDNRHVPNGDRIYYQFLNSDGTVDLEPNGRPLTVNSEGSIDGDFSAIVTPQNQIAVVWAENYRLKAQLIDVNGDRLWGDNGMVVTDSLVLQQRDPQISYEDGAFYIGWSDIIFSQESSQYLYRVFGQKLVNGQPQWGPNGIQITDITPGNQMFEATLEQLKGRYFVWFKYSLDPDTFGTTNIVAKLVNPDGTTAQGWSTAGIAASNYAEWDCYQHQPKCLVTNAGLFAAWFDFRVDFIKRIYGQLLSPQGVRLWDEAGIDFTPGDHEVNDFTLLYNDNAINLFWSLNLGMYQNNLYLSKISLSGEALPGASNLLISNDNINDASSSAQVVSFPNQSMLVAWQRFRYVFQNSYQDGSDINFRYLSPDCSFQSNIGMFLTEPLFDKQLQPRLAAVGNEAYLVWIDSDFYYNPDRCDPEYIESYDIYAQKLSNEFVAIDDEVVIPTQLTLRQNYPNPFTTETSISFSIPEKGEARIEIFNLKGQKVRTILNSLQEKGNATVTWDGLDSSGKSCSTGIYYCKLTANGNTQTRKMLLVK